MKHRLEIDGLRALAVIPVILFHANIDLFQGGFVGVDIFFVISGFLITRIILSEIYQSSFSIIHFYERRARRILPAFFAVLIFSTLGRTRTHGYRYAILPLPFAVTHCNYDQHEKM